MPADISPSPTHSFSVLTHSSSGVKMPPVHSGASVRAPLPAPGVRRGCWWVRGGTESCGNGSIRLGLGEDEMSEPH